MIAINSETGEILRDRSDYYPPDEVRALIKELCVSRNAKDAELAALRAELEEAQARLDRVLRLNIKFVERNDKLRAERGAYRRAIDDALPLLYRAYGCSDFVDSAILVLDAAISAHPAPKAPDWPSDGSGA